MKKKRNSPKAKRACRKPRRGVNPLKRGSIFGSYDPWKGTIFAPGFRKSAPLDSADPGGWEATFAKLNIKRLVADAVAKRKQYAKKLAARLAAQMQHQRDWKRREDKEKRLFGAAKLVDGKVAEQVVMAVLSEGQKHRPYAAARIVNSQPDKKTEAIHDALRNFYQGYHFAGDRVAHVNKDTATIYYARKGIIDKIPLKLFGEIAERIYRTKRPKWMLTVEQDRKLVREKERQDKKYEQRERKFEAKRKKDDAKFLRKHEKRRLWMLAHPAEVKKEQAIREANQKKEAYERRLVSAKENANLRWLQKTAAEIAQMIRKAAGRKANLDEVAEVINRALEVQGWKRKEGAPVMGWEKQREVPDFVAREAVTDSGKRLGKLEFGGNLGQLHRLLPGVPEPNVRMEDVTEED